MAAVVSSPVEQTKRFDALLTYLHAVYFLTGIGIMMLGPLLPALSQQWRLSDGSSGNLLAAQFVGSFLGSITVHRDLRRSLTVGSVCVVSGYGMLSIAAHLAPGVGIGIVALALAGFGLGRLINSISVIAGTRYSGERGRALMSLNLIWSLGAVLAPLLVSGLLGCLSLASLAGIFASLGLLLLAYQMGLPASAWHLQTVHTDTSSAYRTAAHRVLPLAYFGVLFFLYGAFENSISGWLSSFAVRYTSTSEVKGVLSSSLLWVGIILGRAASLLLLRVLPQRRLQLWSLALAVIGSAMFPLVHNQCQFLPLTIAIGCGLAPFVPITASLFLSRARPTAGQAGRVLAILSLGAALAQWGIGQISQHYSSLRLAFHMPPSIGFLLLIVCVGARRMNRYGVSEESMA
jgi:fucose permease